MPWTQASRKHQNKHLAISMSAALTVLGCTPDSVTYSEWEIFKLQIAAQAARENDARLSLYAHLLTWQLLSPLASSPGRSTQHTPLHADIPVNGCKTLESYVLLLQEVLQPYCCILLPCFHHECSVIMVKVASSSQLTP